MDAEWLPDEGITASIKSQFESSEDGKEHENYLRHRLERSLSLTNDVKGLLMLSNLLARTTEGKSDSIQPFEELTYRFGLADSSIIAKEYTQALVYFDKHIKSSSFVADGRTSLLAIKSGCVLVSKGDTSDESPRHVSIVALERAPLDALQTLLELLGKIKNPEKYSVFSPEEELLEPYVDFLDSTLANIEMSQSVKQHFKKMIADYYDENFTGTVSTASLVAEECLSQIFETIARQPVPKNLTLGQLSQAIGTTAKEILSPKSAAVYQTSKDALEKVKNLKIAKAPSSNMSAVAKVLVGYIDSTSNKLQDEWKELKDGNADYRVFPPIIKMNLEDVITYRNAAAHKSTDPIDSLKALKSIYGSLSLIVWWNNSRKTIDGSNPKKEVLEQLIELAKVYG